MSIEEAEKLYAEAVQMKHSRKQADLAFRAYELAQAAGNTYAAFNARLLELQARVFSEDHAGALVTFAWMLAEYEKNKEEYAQLEWDFLWGAKWVAGNMGVYIDAPREKIDEHMELYKKLLKEHGYSEQSYYQQLAKVLPQLGDVKEGFDYGEKAAAMSRDGISDCASCAREAQTDNLFLLKEYDEFFKRSEEFRKDSTDACPEPMINAMGNAALYFVMNDNPEQVKYYLFQAEKIAKRDSDDPDVHMEAKYIFAQTKIGNVDTALAHFESDVAFVYADADPLAQLEYFKAGAILMDALAAENETVVMHVKDGVEWANEKNEYTPQEVAKTLRAQAEELAKKVDARNGNSYCMDNINTVHGVA